MNKIGNKYQRVPESKANDRAKRHFQVVTGAVIEVNLVAAIQTQSEWSPESSTPTPG
jgi:hypothetical protein